MWQSILNWNGYGLLGIALAVIGNGLTIYFARAAKISAASAEQAANSAKSTIKSIDAFAQCKLIERHLLEIRLRLDHEQWDNVSDSAISVRSCIVSILDSISPDKESKLYADLAEMRAQMTILSDAAIRHLHKKKNADPIQIKRTLGNQIEQLASIEVELRRALEG